MNSNRKLLIFQGNLLVGCWKKSPSLGLYNLPGTSYFLRKASELLRGLDFISFPLLSLSGTASSQPFPLPDQPLPLFLPPQYCHCCVVFVFINSCVCRPPVLKAISIWVKHFETNQKPRFSSPAVSHPVLYLTSLLSGPVCTVNKAHYRALLQCPPP